MTNVEVYQPIARGLFVRLHPLCILQGGGGGGVQGIFLKGAKFSLYPPHTHHTGFLTFLLLSKREKTQVLVKYGQYDEVVQKFMFKRNREPKIKGNKMITDVSIFGLKFKSEEVLRN